MGRTSFIRFSILLAVSLILATSAFAEHLFGPEELDTTFGVTFRFRQETWDNVFDLKNVSNTTTSTNSVDRNFFRLKTSLWYKMDYSKKYDFLVKFTNEAQYFLSDRTDRYPGEPNARFVEDEIVFDNLYAGANGIFGIPLDIRIGRQDFLFTHGEGFLILDGTPLDGSRTFYFNAAKANIKFGEKANVDLIYITDQETDLYLPSMYAGVKRQINYSDEQGVVVYGRIKATEGLSVEPYYIYKKEQDVTRGAALQPELDLNTVGARAVFGFGGGWKLRGEFAYQFGEYGNSASTDREGYGGYAYIGRKYEDVGMKPGFDLGAIYLSGDDPDTTDKDEGWDPLFSRWPWLSELYVFTLGKERGIAYWSNLQAYRANFNFKIGESSGLDLTYIYMLANENATGTFFSDGKERGHLPQAKLSHQFSKAVDGYVLVEYFVPGDFYSTDNNDNAAFVRWQLQWKI